MTDVSLIGGTSETREVLRALLRLHHYRVKGEGRGLKDAKKLLQESPDGIFLVDADLADGTWEEVLQATHSSKHESGVVLISPFYGTEFESKAKRLGASAVLLRPFEIPELLEALKASSPA
jgi:response regulator RpfG family c-di-GMP phosphodiesterase